jgi:hypothetical protein
LRAGPGVGGPQGAPVHNLFVHVLILVDTNRVVGYRLPAVADYVALLALSTEMSLDTCGELPSILDLMSSGCGEREKPAGLTQGDTAYLKALYSVNQPWSVSDEKDAITEQMAHDIPREAAISAPR